MWVGFFVSKSVYYRQRLVDYWEEPSGVGWSSRCPNWVSCAVGQTLSLWTGHSAEVSEVLSAIKDPRTREMWQGMWAKRAGFKGGNHLVYWNMLACWFVKVFCKLNYIFDLLHFSVTTAFKKCLLQFLKCIYTFVHLQLWHNSCILHIAQCILADSLRPSSVNLPLPHLYPVPPRPPPRWEPLDCSLYLWVCCFFC